MTSILLDSLPTEFFFFYKHLLISNGTIMITQTQFNICTHNIAQKNSKWNGQIGSGWQCLNYVQLRALNYRGDIFTTVCEIPFWDQDFKFLTLISKELYLFVVLKSRYCGIILICKYILYYSYKNCVCTHYWTFEPQDGNSFQSHISPITTWKNTFHIYCCKVYLWRFLFYMNQKYSFYMIHFLFFFIPKSW